MRHALFLLALFAASPLWADDKPKLPANLQTVPEPPPPPPGYELNPALEPQITITTRGEDKAEEYRIGGASWKPSALARTWWRCASPA